jgi:hypothetical protein
MALAQKLVSKGPEELFRKLKEGMSHRRELDEMRKLSETIPAVTAKLQTSSHKN